MNVQNLIAMTTGQQQPQLSLSENAPNLPLNTESTDTTTPAPTVTDDATRTSEEFSTFLTLLTAQIRNQDPLAPLDSTQFVEQLATFSNLELQAQGNAVLEDISVLLARNLSLSNAETTDTPSDET